jgi:phenylacetate-CoA ligase
MAFECRQHHYHVHADNVVLEFLRDGHPVAPGEEGEVVVTGLVNRAMPLIRYRIGDLGALSARPCPCGRGLPTMELIAGRKEDVLLADGERKISPITVVAFMYDVLNDVPEITHYQIRQRAVGDFEVVVVAGPAADRPTLAEALRQRLPPLLGDNSRIEVCFVETLPRTPSGKAQIVFNELYRPGNPGWDG